MIKFLKILLLVSVIGLIASLFIHILSFFRIGDGGLVLAIMVPLFLIGFPLIFLMRSSLGSFDRKIHFNNAIYRSPVWIQWLVKITRVYILLNFVTLLFVDPSSSYTAFRIISSG